MIIVFNIVKNIIGKICFLLNIYLYVTDVKINKGGFV